MLLDHSVNGRAHMSSNMRYSKHVRGCCMSFTVHWVKLLLGGKDAGWGTPLGLLMPPHVLNFGAGNNPVISSLSSSVASFGHSSEPLAPSKCYSSGKKLPNCFAAFMPGIQKPHWARDAIRTPGQGSKVADPTCAMQSCVRQWQQTVGLPSAGKLHTCTLLGTCVKLCVMPVMNILVQRFLVKYPGLQRCCSSHRSVQPL